MNLQTMKVGTGSSDHALTGDDMMTTVHVVLQARPECRECCIDGSVDRWWLSSSCGHANVLDLLVKVNCAMPRDVVIVAEHG